MAITRNLQPHLWEWKNSANRKPLLLRGARQVGKTTLIKQFAESYEYFIYLNLEVKKDRNLFSQYSSVSLLIDSLSIQYNIPKESVGNTLLFIDEIQESTEAIESLRYFYEYEPDLHVIAAGSLLEYALKRLKTFPVGRVNMLYLYPFNFREYLTALDKSEALKELDRIPVCKSAHSTLIQLFNDFVIIGGMPEVVKQFAKEKSVSQLQSIYESIWETYKEDVMKYASNSTEARVIKHIMNVAPLQLDARIKFQNFGNSAYRSREVSEAFKSLDDAKIIQVIHPITSSTPPMLPNLARSPRLQFLDTGLINYSLNLQPELLSLDDISGSYKGSILPHMIHQEILSLNTFKHKKTTFWVREKLQSSAEIDLVILYNKNIIPIEIKSGKIGKLKSLHQFINEAPHPYAIRMYAGEFSVEKHTTSIGKDYFLMNLPYYLATRLNEYLELFTSNYK